MTPGCHRRRISSTGDKKRSCFYLACSRVKLPLMRAAASRPSSHEQFCVKMFLEGHLPITHQQSFTLTAGLPGVDAREGSSRRFHMIMTRRQFFRPQTSTLMQHFSLITASPRRRKWSTCPVSRCKASIRVPTSRQHCLNLAWSFSQQQRPRISFVFPAKRSKRSA